MSFCHLHVHNEYSLLDGCGKAEDYAKKAKRLGFKYLGLTNHGNIDGLIKFQKACDEQGIIPIHGCEFYIVEDARVKRKGEKRKHLVALIKNKRGWRSVCRMLNYANSEGFYNRPRIDPRILLDNLDGLVIMTACIGSFISTEWGIHLMDELIDEIEDDLYIEVMPNIHKLQVAHNKACATIARQLELPLVATVDCHYVEKDEEETQQVLLAINSKAKWDDKDRFKFEFKDLHFCSEGAVVRAFKRQGALKRGEYLSAIRNSVRIAKGCSGFRIERRRVRLPRLKYDDPNTELHRRAQEGLDKLPLSDRKRVVYSVRMERELGLIRKKKFSAYFLIVCDLLEYCKKNDIMWGPGRGSVGCCLVAYLLGITAIDSLRWKLPFDRFISEDRIDFPDIDLDFENTKTDLIREYFEDIYGEKKVFGISTFGKMKGKAVIHDVSRVFNVPRYESMAMADVVSDEKDVVDAVNDAVEGTSVGQEFASEYPMVIEHASRLEGQVRNAGQHAAALVIASGREDDAVLVKRKKGFVCNWDMDDAEYMGLMKFDILKLNNISILSETKKMVKQNHEIEIEYEKIPLDDGKVFDRINKGEVTGIFQVAGWSTASVLSEVLVDDFMIISDVIALSRPGPKDSGMTEEYIKRRVTGDWGRKHDLFEKETKDTYGVVVYQEQVMGIMRSVAGFSYSDADRIRKIIGKKRDKKEFAPFKQQFIRGALKKRTLTREEAEAFWSGLEEHARYSFNRAHSVEYAMIAYWDMWLKVYYPEEFIAASLTYGSDKHKAELVADARDMGLELVTPKIGVSDGSKWVVKGKKIYIPFKEVKGIGDAALPEIEGVLKRMRTASSIHELFGARKKFVPPRKTRVEKILYDIGAYKEGSVTGVESYFGFPVVAPVQFPIREQSFLINRSLAKCTRCSLRGGATRPVLPSRGRFNVVIVGEAPGPDEDAEGVGFIGRAGQLLWGKEEGVGKYGLKRKWFHITNICKCYPSVSGKPNDEQIKTCYEEWLRDEIASIEAKVILAFGNTSRKCFIGKGSGITKVSGTIEWVDKLNANVVWCVHPAAVLRNRSENLVPFRKGIEKFYQVLVENHMPPLEDVPF